MKDVNVGEKVLEFRKAQNLTIKHLAERANVTSSLLSQIERGLANPSINTLKSISKALDIPLYSFFIDYPDPHDLVVREHERSRITFPSKEGYEYELLLPENNTNMKLILMELQPRSSSSENLINHRGEEVAHVTEGRVLLYLEDKKILLEHGDSVKILPNMNHRWQNTSNTICKVIMAQASSIY